MERKLPRVALKTSAAYWLVASLWILLSDRAVLAITSDPEIISRLSLYKGWAFVVVTAALLYVALRTQMARIQRESAARWEAQRELRSSEELYRSLLLALPDAVVMTDLQGTAQFVSSKTLEVYNHSSVDEILGRNILEWVAPEDLPFVKEKLQALLSSGLLLGTEATLLRKDGSRFAAEVSGALLRNPDKSPRGFILVSRDITERKRTQNELTTSNNRLRQLTDYLQSVREEERKRISREIHDELGQELTALKMQAALASKAVAKALPENSGLIEDTRTVLTISDKAIRTVRRIAAQLRPEVLEERETPDALRWQADEFKRLYGIPCNIECPQLSRIKIPDDIATAILRIFQEALTNIARHAQATDVRAKFECVNGMLHMTITDNGRGMNDPEQAGQKSLGLAGISERARLLGGRTSITSEPGAGTTVEAWIPLDCNAQKG